MNRLWAMLCSVLVFGFVGCSAYQQAKTPQDKVLVTAAETQVALARAYDTATTLYRAKIITLEAFKSAVANLDTVGVQLENARSIAKAGDLNTAHAILTAAIQLLTAVEQEFAKGPR